MLYLMLWLLCALTAAYVYNQKGRSLWIGALAGLILGPIGVILALLTSKRAPALPTKQCPHCKTQIDWNARVCPTCKGDTHYA